MARSGIASIAAYLPRSRIERATIANATAWANPAAARASGSRTACNWDEDSITMAVAAARHAAPASVRANVESLWFASTTPPFQDRDNAVLIAEALALPPAAHAMTITSSQRAAVSSLIAAAARPGLQLVVAADRRIARPGSDQELRYAHAGAAVLLGSDEPIAEILGHATHSSDLVDHYRTTGESFDYALEERWVRDEGYLKLAPHAIRTALQAASVEGLDVQHLAIHGPASVGAKVAQLSGLSRASAADTLESRIGDTGAAHPLLLLAATLQAAQPGQTIVLVGFGQGVDVIVLRATEHVARVGRQLATQLDGGVNEPHYLRFLSNAGLVAIDWGMRAERDNRTAQSVAYRRRQELTAFIGGQCRQCGTVQFPRARACVNPECRALDTLDPHPLADTRGRVKSFTEDWQAFSPRPPLVYGNIELAGAGNLLMELTDIESGELAVGDEVAMTFRIKDVDQLRGFRRYFWKAVRIRS
jgi:hydroxymethylglutaryl-CoA synthase